LQKVSRFQEKLARQLFSDLPEAEEFLSALHDMTNRKEAIIWLEKRPELVPFELLDVKECFVKDVDILLPGQKPGASELHEKGKIYCLDYSSVFCATAFNEVSIPIENILDVCASPGGKSILAKKRFPAAKLVCNEVINKRIAPLISNLKRCNIVNSVVSCLDVSAIATRYVETFDLVIVDAPCSGQSLLVKGKLSPGAFHPATINLNANRQKRILANSASAVSSGGFLVYMTCTYSIDENEQVLKWFLKKFPHFSIQAIQQLSAFHSRIVDIPCYRLFPHQGFGGGGFVAVMKNLSEGKREKADYWSSQFVWRGPEEVSVTAS
jgi:16S rRNA C967 or C1407 C5-methylase (RsmB/RsmF family)